MLFLSNMIANKDYVITTQPVFCLRKFACAPTSCKIGNLNNNNNNNNNNLILILRAFHKMIKRALHDFYL